MTPLLALNAFPHTWHAEVLAGPPLILPTRSFTFPQAIPGEEEALGSGALRLNVLPTQGGSFLATCTRGFRESLLPTGLWSCPDPDALLAVVGGYAYLVPTRHPEATLLIEQRPVVALLPAPEAGLLLLAGFHDILALDSAGVRWRSARLSWEGVQLGELRDGALHGLGWDMFTDAEVPFLLDLETGRHTGGGYRLSPGETRR